MLYFSKNDQRQRPLTKKGPSSSSPKTPSGKLSQNSHSENEDLLEMSLTETEHGNKDLEAFADRLIKNYDSKVSKLLDEKLDRLNEQFSTRFGKIKLYSIYQKNVQN